MGAWVWFVIAAVAAVAGVALLLIDRGQLSTQSRERRRWAALRGWQFTNADPVLSNRWRHGAMARGGKGTARDLVTGSMFSAGGRRLVHVFDYTHGGSGGTGPVIAAVQRESPLPMALELWLPTVEFPTDAGLDLLGPIGDRYAFTTELAKARPLITPALVELADGVGDDVPVVWVEDAWVMAAAGPATAPARLERLLQALGQIADVIDGVPADQIRTSQPVATGPEDIEPQDIEPQDIEPQDIEPQDIEPQDIEPQDIEPQDVEPVAAGRTGAEPVDPELVDAELVDSELVDAEPVDAELVGTEPVDAGPPGAQPVTAEPVEERPRDARPTDQPPTDLRPADGRRDNDRPSDATPPEGGRPRDSGAP